MSLAIAANTMLLVDCSGNAAQALERLGINWPLLEHVLLTHHHTDHICGLPSLVDQIMLTMRGAERPPLTLWGPESALGRCHQLLEATGLLQREGSFDLQFMVLPPEECSFELGDLAVTSFPVAHGNVPALGLAVAAVDRPDCMLVCSGDTEPCPSVLHRARHARLLVHECSSFTAASVPAHTTLEEIEHVLTFDDVPETLLAHLPPVSEQAEQEVAQRLDGLFGGRERLAEDGAVVQL